MSSDLTTRIQARRAALVRAGEVNPAKPGESTVFGRDPQAVTDLDTRLASMAIAEQRRAARSEPVSEDADDPFEVGEDYEAPELEPDADEAPAPSPAPEPPTPTPTPERPEEEESVPYTEDEPEFEFETGEPEGYYERDEALVSVLAAIGALHERLDAQDRALIALARGLGEAIESLRPPPSEPDDKLWIPATVPKYQTSDGTNNAKSPPGFLKRLFSNAA